MIRTEDLASLSKQLASASVEAKVDVYQTELFKALSSIGWTARKRSLVDMLKSRTVLTKQGEDGVLMVHRQSWRIVNFRDKVMGVYNKVVIPWPIVFLKTITVIALVASDEPENKVTHLWFEHSQTTGPIFF